MENMEAVTRHKPAAYVTQDTNRSLLSTLTSARISMNVLTTHVETTLARNVSMKQEATGVNALWVIGMEVNAVRVHQFDIRQNIIIIIILLSYYCKILFDCVVCICIWYEILQKFILLHFLQLLYTGCLWNGGIFVN